MQTKLSLRYSGPAVESGKMDVYDAAANMIAFSEFTVAAAKATYGKDIDVRAEVAGFGKGSFITDLIISFGGAAVTSLLTTVSPNDVLGMINESINFWKHLAGHPPSNIEPSEDNRIKVTNNNGQINYFRADAVNLVFNDKGTDAVGKFIKDALSKDGVDSVDVQAEVDGQTQQVMNITQNESSWFVPVAAESDLYDQTINAALVIEAPMFKDGNKWRFNDGSGSFYAAIDDPSFLSQVDNGEAFAKGDTLLVLLRIQQKKQGEKLITEKSVMQVIEHKRRSSQYSLI